MILAIIIPLAVLSHFAIFFHTLRRFHIRNGRARLAERKAPGKHGPDCSSQGVDTWRYIEGEDGLQGRTETVKEYRKCDCVTQVAIAWAWELIPLGLALVRAYDRLCDYVNPDVSEVGLTRLERRNKELEDEIARLAKEAESA